jgi:siroheme synthase (precorrin-2 oxidase/ferrochelatase)
MIGYPALPISLYVRGRAVCVIGIGEEADRRAADLSRLGATVRQISPNDFNPEDLGEAFLIFIVASDREQTRLLANQARQVARLVYAQDVPDASDLAMPGVAERGYLKIAISTDGLAPALARHLRQEFQRLFDAIGPVLDRFLAGLSTLRANQPAETRKEVLTREAQRLRIEGGFKISGGADFS